MKYFTKKRISLNDVTALKKHLRKASVNTVCEDAKCPNVGECFSKGVATFLIGGDTCTRSCNFCNVQKGNPKTLDKSEPTRISKLTKKLGLRYVVITCVTRDDIPDGGAQHFCNTVSAIRKLNPSTKVEILTSDFAGNADSVLKAFDSKPDVFSHNIETVPRLYLSARKGADYNRSLNVLKLASDNGLITKSGIMLGLGETEREVMEVLQDIKNAGCSIITIGQYLSPSKKHLPTFEYIQPDKFEFYKKKALKIGFKSCASSTYVRSSYLADSLIAF